MAEDLVTRGQKGCCRRSGTCRYQSVRGRWPCSTAGRNRRIPWPGGRAAGSRSAQRRGIKPERTRRGSGAESQLSQDARRVRRLIAQRGPGDCSPEGKDRPHARHADRRPRQIDIRGGFVAATGSGIIHSGKVILATPSWRATAPKATAEAMIATHGTDVSRLGAIVVSGTFRWSARLAFSWGRDLASHAERIAGPSQ